MSGAPIRVVGTRTFAGELLDFAEASGYEVVALLEPLDRARVGTTIHGMPVSAWLEDADPGPVAIGTGERSRREIVARAAAVGMTFVTVVHPRAHVSPRSTLGEGAVVGPGAVVGAYSSIGAHVVIGRGVLVGHHTEIAEHVTIGPGANVAGNVRLDEDVFVGMGAAVRDHVVVGAGATVSMGAVVTKDVPPGATVRGLPARVVRHDG